MAKKNGKYWTCFVFSGYSPSALHCTHKFLGELSPKEVKSASKIIDGFFKQTPFKAFVASFDEETWFGTFKNIRVLLSHDHKNLFYPGLKKLLDSYNKDVYAFTPHVTCDGSFDKILIPIIGYALMKDQEIIKMWRA
jgi:hypothetical protein